MAASKNERGAAFAAKAMKLKKLLALLLVVAMLASITVSAGAADTKKELRFHDDGTFKIMQLSDFQDDATPTLLTMEYVTACIEEYQPDLIVLTGDNKNSSTGESSIESKARRDVEKCFDSFMSVFERLNVPVAVVFGNHDLDGRINCEEQMKIFCSYDCCIAVDEGDSVNGCGNYNLPILAHDSNKVAFNIWCFDSNGGVDESRLNWYLSKSNQLKEQNSGNLVPSISFQHIIVKEINDALKLPGNPVSGVVHENPCPVDSNQFETMRAQGDVVAMFFGHDHVNTFVAEYQGIDLVNSPSSGFGSYGDNETRGLRLIVLKEDGSYETQVVNYYDKFCKNDIDIARYIMSSDHYSNAQRLAEAAKYCFLSLIQGKAFFAAVKECWLVIL